jgi:ubiquinone/menaquinone biosynthesis C-methylase UbiE
MFSDPEKNIKQFCLAEGSIVADLGAGAGFYSFSAAKIVGAEGKVYSVDIDRDILKRVRAEAQERGLKNIEIIQGDLENAGGSNLADSSVDAVIAANIFFQITNKDALVKEIRRILKPAGKALVIDWKDSFGGMGPAKGAILAEVMAKHFFEVHDFKTEKEIEAGDHHYGIIFRKTDAKV